MATYQFGNIGVVKDGDFVPTQNHAFNSIIPDFFEHYRVMMSNSNDLRIYREVDNAFPGAGEYLHELALSLWHDRKVNTSGIFAALEDINSELAEIVERCFWKANRKQTATKER
jgi:hypothetical protein